MDQGQFALIPAPAVHKKRGCGVGASPLVAGRAEANLGNVNISRSYVIQHTSPATATLATTAFPRASKKLRSPVLTLLSIALLRRSWNLFPLSC